MKNITYILTSIFFIKNTKQLLLITCISCCLFVSCKFSKNKEKVERNSKENVALKIVESAINSAGTIEKWRDIASLKYTKKTRLLLENGQVESEVIQHHNYVFRPHKSIKISWVVDKDRFLIIQDEFVSQKFKNDSLIEQGDNVKSSVNSSLYVIGMPFKLLDKGAILTYDGLKSLNNIDTVHNIKVTYDPKKYQNHSTQDVWWYHIDKNSNAFSSSMVYHKPTYALIENLSVIEKEGLTFPERRKSYRCDKFGKKLFLRAEFWYEDYSIEFLNK